MSNEAWLWERMPGQIPGGAAHASSYAAMFSKPDDVVSSKVQ